MKEEFIYMCTVQNKHTNELSVKVGYTNDILRRMKQLDASNKHYEYTHYRLFKHVMKTQGYIYDEQSIHRSSVPYRANLNSLSMPVGFTECYEWTYTNDLIKKLGMIGYVCIYDEYFQDEPEPEPKMFEWSNNENMEQTKKGD